MIGVALLIASVLILALASGAVGQEMRDGEVLVLGAASGNALDVRFPDGAIYTVRLIGVNAPRIDAPDIGTECYGLEAKDFLNDLVAGKTVRLERQVSDTNAQGRLLRDVWMQDDTGNDVPLAVILTSKGYTEAQAVPPDTMMAEQIEAAEADARARALGRWGAC